MAKLLVVLLFPLLAIAQSTVLWRALPGEATLDLVLLLTIACGGRSGAAAGSAAGLWAGALVAALRGSLAGPMALLYGLAGWLAGIHAERAPKRWTYPVVGVALTVLVSVAESELSRAWGGAQPGMLSLLPTLAWNALACLALLGAPRAKCQA